MQNTRQPLDLDEIAARAAGLYEYATGLDDAWQAEADQLAGTDVPALLAEVHRLRAERDRYRGAWQSARFRAEAYGEGILRVVKDREAYQGWLKQAEENYAAYRTGAEGAKRMLADRVNAVTDLCDEQEMAARLFELPAPEWIAAVRHAVEHGTTAPAAG
jgi:hypothetical protein